MKKTAALIITIILVIATAMIVMVLVSRKLPLPVTNSVASTNQTENKALRLYETSLVYPEAYNGPLYDASQKTGDSGPLDLLANDMRRNGVNFFIGYFFLQEKSDLEYLQEALSTFPERLVPFFSSGLSADEAAPIVGEELTGLFEVGLASAKTFFKTVPVKGIGEIETHEWNMPHNDPRVLQLFDFAAKNHLQVMFHVATGQQVAIRDILSRYPETTFLIHMYQDDFAREREEIMSIMSEYLNISYTIDVDHLLFDRESGTGLLYKYQNDPVEAGKASFVADFDAKYEEMLAKTFALYRPLIALYPDRVLWGTEMNTRYSYEPEVYDRMIKFIRLFLGKLAPNQQVAVGYQNALRVFGPNVEIQE